jgi:UDP-N-acetylmuramate--alanine ligase
MKPDPHVRVPAAERLGHVHLLGIGGAGMSGIARILLARGLEVSGSDARESPALDVLRGLGATVHVGHDAAHVAGADTVVVSSAVRESNPELVEARRRGLLVLHRSQALAALMSGRRAVAVAGTHGKTTTTSMTTVALVHCGADPSFVIGGELTEGGANARDGSGDVFVAEADESDGSFLLYSPQVAVVTNVEPDHLDHYGTAQAVTAAFDAFCDTVAPGGLVVACADDEGSSSAARGARARRPDLQVVTYGQAADSDVRVVDLDVSGPGARFALVRATGGGEQADGERVELALRVPGRHNALDAAAAFVAVTGLGLPAQQVARGLETFGGARRRFEEKGVVGGVRVVDDYAHHPTEVEAVLTAARGVAGDGRVLAVFQPHLFSRTRIFAAEFGRALGLADEVVVLEVYGAREDPEPGVSGASISTAVPLPADQVAYEPSWPAALARVAGRARPGDLVLTIGAGDVTRMGPELLRTLAAGSSRGSGG